MSEIACEHNLRTFSTSLVAAFAGQPCPMHARYNINTVHSGPEEAALAAVAAEVLGGRPATILKIRTILFFWNSQT